MKLLRLTLVLLNWSVSAQALSGQSPSAVPTVIRISGRIGEWANEYHVSLHVGYTLEQHWQAIGRDLSERTISYVAPHADDAADEYIARIPDDELLKAIQQDNGVAIVRKWNTWRSQDEGPNIAQTSPAEQEAKMRYYNYWVILGDKGYTLEQHWEAIGLDLSKTERFCVSPGHKFSRTSMYLATITDEGVLKAIQNDTNVGVTRGNTDSGWGWDFSTQEESQAVLAELEAQVKDNKEKGITSDETESWRLERARETQVKGLPLCHWIETASKKPDPSEYPFPETGVILRVQKQMLNWCQLNITEAWTCQPNGTNENSPGTNRYARVRVASPNGTHIYSGPEDTSLPGRSIEKPGWAFKAPGMSRGLVVLADHFGQYMHIFQETDTPGSNDHWIASSMKPNRWDIEGKCWLDGDDWDIYAVPRDCPESPGLSRKFICRYPCNGNPRGTMGAGGAL